MALISVRKRSTAEIMVSRGNTIRCILWYRDLMVSRGNTITLGHSSLLERLPCTADLMVSRGNGKTQVTSNASNETPRFDAVYFLEAVLVGFNYLNYILKHPFREITLIIIETNTLPAKHSLLPATVFWNEM